MTGSDTLLRDYSYYLRLERNLSPHTVSSYLSDVREALSDPVFGDRIGDVTSDAVLAYLGGRPDLSKRSQSRVLSALRSFFGWTVEEGYRKENPCDGIASPKLGRYLPAVLSVDEVAAIMDSVDLSSPGGLRDRAILEVLYGCGLRVSEACGLRISDVFLEEGFVRVIGKGDKQRLVPLGEVAADAVRAYLEVRGEPADTDSEDILAGQ